MSFEISIQTLYRSFVANKAMSSTITKEQLTFIRDTLAEFINFCVDCDRPVVLGKNKVGGEEYLLKLRETFEKVNPLNKLNI